MEEKIRSLLLDYTQHKTGTTPELLALRATDPWDLYISFCLPGSGLLEIRNVREDDLETFLAFRRGLSAASRDSFRPYPWDSEDRLFPALRTAIGQAVGRVDACYFMLHEALPAGEFFLWRAGGNHDSRLHGLEVPELGVGFADAYHGRGLGGLSTRFLTIVAEHLKADGIELTTTMENEPGFRTYLGAGYEYVGDIVNPLEVDVTAVLGGQAGADRWRIERQMIHVIDRTRRAALLAYLAEKRQWSRTLATRSGYVLAA